MKRVIKGSSEGSKKDIRDVTLPEAAHIFQNAEILRKQLETELSSKSKGLIADVNAALSSSGKTIEYYIQIYHNGEFVWGKERGDYGAGIPVPLEYFDSVESAYSKITKLSKYKNNAEYVENYRET